MARLTLTTVDRMSKSSSMTFGVIAGDIGANVASLVTALEAIILGSAVRAVQTTDTVIDAGSQSPPNDANADRYNKWLFRVQDGTTGVIYNHEIGTADNSVLPAANTDYIDLSTGAGATLKSAFEQVWRSPVGNTGTLLSVQQVNRTG